MDDEDFIVSHVCDEELERQLEEQAAKRRELEITLKLLEKDAWAKQATVGALRKQLEDIKMINQDIGNKIRVRVTECILVSFINLLHYDFVCVLYAAVLIFCNCDHFVSVFRQYFWHFLVYLPYFCVFTRATLC